MEVNKTSHIFKPNTHFNDILTIYPHLCYIAYWLNSINPANTFTKDIKTLIARYPVVDPAALGCPRGWQDEPLWR